MTENDSSESKIDTAEEQTSELEDQTEGFLEGGRDRWIENIIWRIENNYKYVVSKGEIISGAKFPKELLIT